MKLKGRKKPSLDCVTRMNSTFEMLDNALGMRDTFCHLEQMDTNYRSNPSNEEWEVAKITFDCLKKNYEATYHFSGTSFLT